MASKQVLPGNILKVQDRQGYVQSRVSEVSPLERATGRFIARVAFRGKCHALGTFATIPEAEAVVVAKRIELGVASP